MPGARKNSLVLLLILGVIAGCNVDQIHKPGDDASSVVPAANMKVARSAHTATLLPNGDVLIAGGMNSNESYSDTVEIYSPATNTFRSVQSMSARRVGHTATLLPNGKVLLAGGYDGAYLASAEIYDPATGRFTPAGQMTTPRCDHVAVLLNNGKVVLAGGVGTGWTFLASAEVYDPIMDAFTRTGSMAEPRVAHTATLLRNGRVLIAGGHKDRREAMTVFSSAEVYDPTNGTFSAAGNMTAIRHKHAASLLPDGNVLIVGGSDQRDWQGKYASAEIYEWAKGEFKAIGEMNMARFKLASAVVSLRNGKILIAGGGEWLELYDPATMTFSTVKTRIDTARFFSAATLLQDDQVLITGGYDNHIKAGAKAWIYKTAVSTDHAVMAGRFTARRSH
jgi:N-acetylneuraminic acid mutarotase